MKQPYQLIKRCFDCLISGIGMVVLLPFWPFLWLAIKLDSPGPMLFRQQRVGRHKKLFTLYKLRTMRTDAPKDTPTHLLGSGTSHITRLGGWMRRSSVDELPQLFNIFKGDMSIVGPRPALWNQDDLVAERDKYGANDLRPGLTGLAQIRGRDELPLDVKAAYDGEYVGMVGFRTDCRILIGTISKVLSSEGVAEGGPQAPLSDDKDPDSEP